MKTWRTGCIMGFCFLGLLVRPSWSETCLEIRTMSPPRTIASLPIMPGGSVVLESVNSIYRAPVKETLTYSAEKGLVLTKVESASAGVFEYYGLPTDGTAVAAFERVIGEITVRSHDYEHHRIVVGKRSVRLKGLVADGEALRITVISDGDCADRTFR